MSEVKIIPPQETTLTTRVGRIQDRLGKWLHSISPKGRYETYMTKYRDSLETQSPEQHYRTRKQLETDAAKFARDTMVRDFVVGTAVVGGTILLGTELLTHKPSTALRAFRGELMRNLEKTSINAAGHVIAYGGAFGKMVGDMATKAATSAVTEASRSEEHTSELQSQSNLVCRL